MAFQSPPGDLGRKIFDVGTLFLRAVFLFLTGSSVVLIQQYFKRNLIPERIQRRESLGHHFFLSFHFRVSKLQLEGVKPAAIIYLSSALQ